MSGVRFGGVITAVAALGCVSMMLQGCTGGKPTPPPTPSTPRPSPSPSPRPSPTVNPTAALTPTPTPTPTSAVSPAPTAVVSITTFVPACIAKKCYGEFIAVAEDKYTSALTNCARDNFGPCASRAWDCLGDETCRKAVTCAPRVFDTCKADIWKLMTNEKERTMIMCIAKCPVGKDGKPSRPCVLEKCGQAAADCLLDETCRHVVNCVPQTMMACSASAFSCIFSSDGVCRDNVKCLGKGIAQCSAPGVNILTDTKIADLVTCAGSKCPHPATVPPGNALTVSISEGASLPAPIDAIGELLCMEAKCPSKLPKLLLDQDSKDLLTCAGKTNFSPIWDCLGDVKCQNALSCWSRPLETCTQDIWHLLTNDVERQRIEQAATCLRTCEQKHHNDFVAASLCMLDDCSQGLLDCYHDNACRSAVQCLPAVGAQCSIPALEAYTTQPVFRKAVKSLSLGLETCGRAALEMLRDQNIAEGIRCAAQCTRKPNGTSANLMVV